MSTHQRRPGRNRRGMVAAFCVSAAAAAAALCDDGDFLAGVAYKQTRQEATTQVEACRTHLQARFQQGVAAAAGLLDGGGRIDPGAVDLAKTCTFFGRVAGRAKCEVLE